MARSIPFRLEILYKGTKHKKLSNKIVTVQQILALEPDLDETVFRERCWKIWEAGRHPKQGVIINDQSLKSGDAYVSSTQRSEKKREAFNNKWLKTRLVPVH